MRLSKLRPYRTLLALAVLLLVSAPAEVVARAEVHYVHHSAVSHSKTRWPVSRLNVRIARSNLGCRLSTAQTTRLTTSETAAPGVDDRIAGLFSTVARDLGLILGVVGVVLIYFAPAIVAESRRHRNLKAITALNLCLGLTVVGWVGALIWALMRDKKTAPVATTVCDVCGGPVARARESTWRVSVAGRALDRIGDIEAGVRDCALKMMGRRVSDDAGDAATVASGLTMEQANALMGHFEALGIPLQKRRELARSEGAY